MHHDGIGRGTFDRQGAEARLLIARRTAEVEALPSIIEDGLAKGLRFVTVSELRTYQQASAAPVPQHLPGAGDEADDSAADDAADELAGADSDTTTSTPASPALSRPDAP